MAARRALAGSGRAEKLYHTATNSAYTGTWWTEAHNVDLTDPDTLADARRVLERTIVKHKNEATFVGAWFRTRDNHLPISFSDATLARFRTAFSHDALAGTASRARLIASYEGDRKLYDQYITWWLGCRAAFFDQLCDYLARALGNDQAQLLFTPWPGEPIPMLRDKASGPQGNPVQITSDDPAWWEAFARQQPDSSWFRWALMPTSFQQVVSGDYYRWSLAFRETIPPPPHRFETFHSAPNGDPARYKTDPRVMLTYPIGRLFTVARPDLLDSYRSRAGLTVVRHYPLNEDDHDRTKGASRLPFDGQVGYIAVDVDRAGPCVRLLEARAVANGDPRNLAYLCGSSFSTGFPGYVRQFNVAFLAVPALPSTVVQSAASDPEVVVREIRAPQSRTYYYVVNLDAA